MSHFEKNVTTFRAFAEEVLATHVAELKSIENSFLISGKLARITIFNTHLSTLNHQLEDRVKYLSKNGSKELEEMLTAISREYINEFMCISFIKTDT